MKLFKVRNRNVRNLIFEKIRDSFLSPILDVHFLASLKTLSPNFDLQYTKKLTSILVVKNKLLRLRVNRLRVKKNIDKGGTLSDLFFAFPTFPVAWLFGIPTCGISLAVYFINCRKKKIAKPYQDEMLHLDNKIKRTKDILYKNGGRFV